MLVQDVMTRNTWFCTSEDALSKAARVMRDADIGCLPVVNEERQPIAMLTDRDICIAAYELDLPISQIKVSTAMSKGVFLCTEKDSLAIAERIMRDWQIRRLPVVDTSGTLVGVLSLNDIVLSRSRDRMERAKEHVLGDIVQTMEAICRHRPNRAKPLSGLQADDPSDSE